MKACGIVKTLRLPFPSVVAVVGCGGKTSLIKRLAVGYQNENVLISPTTKMYPIKVGNTHCRGVFNIETGKLEALPADELADLASRYGIVLLEADGSRSLPCKGWLESEPVVPAYCTHTVGVVTMNGLAKAATREIVHNLPQFLSLTGLCEGQTITTRALCDMVCAPDGMFKNSAGSRVLIVNQVEDQKAAEIAGAFLLTIQKSDPAFFAKLLYGSAHNDIWWEV